jgi:hypothetical protein
MCIKASIGIHDVLFRNEGLYEQQGHPEILGNRGTVSVFIKTAGATP